MWKTMNIRRAVVVGAIAMAITFYASAAAAQCPESLDDYGFISGSENVNQVSEGKVVAVRDYLGGAVFFSSVRVKLGSQPGEIFTCIRFPIANPNTEVVDRDGIRSTALLSLILGYDFIGNLLQNPVGGDVHRIVNGGLSQ